MYIRSKYRLVLYKSIRKLDIKLIKKVLYKSICKGYMYVL